MHDLNEMSITELTAIWNSRQPTDKQIKKFSTKADAIRRVGAMLADEEAYKKQIAPTKSVKAKPSRVAEAKGPKRIELLMEILAQRPYGIAELAEIYNTTPRVISNDLCDIRKQLGKGFVLKREAKTYAIQPVA